VTAEEPRHVVATAGHVDHGKSALIRALTGIEPDRLEEERRRGLTIDLGYAWTTLPSGREVGFVDVPGHERFVKNMLAGVGPVRLVLFVVAADEGWKPQSEEHLQIVDVLGAERAVVALTKADAVDEDTLALRREEIAGRLAGTALDGAPVVAVSSLTGEGVPQVAEALDEMLAAATLPETTGRPRLFVDRVFSMRGSGTVVTGTLTGGPLQLDDAVVLLPSGARARVRGLQTHGRAIERAVPVSRVAVNLSGVSTEDAHRGDALVRPDAWRTTRVFEGSLRAADALERPLSARGAFKVHAGAAERDARIRLLSRDRLDPGQEGFVRVTLSAPLVLDPGEPYVLREAGMQATVGGGRVLDPHPPARPGPNPAARLEARRVPRAELPAAVVAERGAVDAAELAAVTGVRSTEITGARRLGPWWVATWFLEREREAVRARLESHHAASPLSAGLSIEELRREAGANGALTDVLLHALGEEGLIERTGTTVRLAGRRVELGDREPDARRIESALEDGWPAPPTAAELGAGQDLLRAMVETGRAVEVSRELYLLPGQVAAAEAVARELAAGPEGMTASAFRERLGTSRKYAIPLLELFDARGLTRRAGDVRRLRGPSADAAAGEA
jgi:selenocysteine-specific elongation factor